MLFAKVKHYLSFKTQFKHYFHQKVFSSQSSWSESGLFLSHRHLHTLSIACLFVCVPLSSLKRGISSFMLVSSAHWTVPEMDGWMDAWMDGCMDGWMHGWIAAMRTQLKLVTLVYTKDNHCGFVEPRMERAESTLKINYSLISNSICSV